MRNLKTFENFSNQDMKSRQEMTEYLMSCGYSVEECDSMGFEEMCQVCDECGGNNMMDVMEARKYSKKTPQAQKKEAQKAQKDADKKIAQAQKTVAQAQKALTQAQKERAQAQKVQGQKTAQPTKGAQPNKEAQVKTFSQVQEQKNKTAQKGSQKMTQKEKELAAKWPPADKITKGDFIKAAIENKNKKTTKKTTTRKTTKRK